MPTAILERTVGDLVAERPGRARVFEKYGIDYCCGGEKPLVDVCNKKKLDSKKVIDELDAADAHVDASESINWSTASLTELCGNIESTHHAYLKRELPRLQFIIHKVATVHGPRDARLYEVSKLFDAMKPDLEKHMAKEESRFFPLCRQLEQGTAPASHGALDTPIHNMIKEHQDTGDAIAQIRELTDDYAVPPEACNTYRAMLDGLIAFERDMHQHVHKENSILFPRAAKMEAARG